MTGRIDKIGELWIDRGSGEERQKCPWTPGFDHHSDGRSCGTWCPHFGTVRVTTTGLDSASSLQGKHILCICHETTLVFDSLKHENGG